MIGVALQLGCVPRDRTENPYPTVQPITPRGWTLSVPQQPIRCWQMVIYVNWLGSRQQLAAAGDRPVTDQTLYIQSGRQDARGWDVSFSVYSGTKAIPWPGSCWPNTCLLQGELRAEEGEVKRCSTMSAGEGVRGLLPAGTGTAPASQYQLQLGQGLPNETHHQLPALEKTSKHW